MINPIKTGHLHGFSVYELLWIMFTLEQHMVIIISSLKPLQKRTIPNSYTSNSFIKEYVKLSDLPQLLLHAVHASCFFSICPSNWRNYIIMTVKSFSHFSQIQQMTGQATGLEFHRVTSPRARCASRTAEPSCWSPACPDPLCLSLWPLCQLSSRWALEKPSWISHITVTVPGTTSSGSAVDQEHSYWERSLPANSMGWWVEELSWDWQWGVQPCWLLFHLSSASSDRNVREASTLGKLLAACRQA